MVVRIHLVTVRWFMAVVTQIVLVVRNLMVGCQ